MRSRRHAAEEDASFDVIGDVGEADLCLGTADADGPDEEIHAVFLLREDMFDKAADL